MPMSQFPNSLIQGYRAFKRGRHAKQRDLYRSLAEQGQKPEVMVIACSDSRSAPETLFNASPGELFVVRNVANLVPPRAPDGMHHATSAALEFAVEKLGVKHLVVLGHARCGGIQAVLNPADQALSEDDFIGAWLRVLKPTAESVAGDDRLSPAERQTALERRAIRYSIENLRSFPCVSVAEQDGRLNLHGAWFDIASGELWTLNPESGSFLIAK